jgi:hypothetical protein
VACAAGAVVGCAAGVDWPQAASTGTTSASRSAIAESDFRMSIFLLKLLADPS